jgi:hypothetical protein
MTIDFSNDLAIATRAISGYVKKGTQIPENLLTRYNKLLSVSGSLVTSGGGGGGGISLTQAQVQTAFTNALQSQSQTEFQDVLLEDSNGVVYIATRTIDEETSTVTFTNRLPNGTTYTPVGASSTPRVKDAEFSEVRWTNTAGVDYSIGDKITYTTNKVTGGINYWNATTNQAITSSISLSNLVTSIDQVVIQGTITTTAHTSDLPFFAGTFTDSTNIAIPTIDGRKANTFYIIRTGGSNSPLFPNDTGVIYAIHSGSSFRAPIGTGNVNRPNQSNISNIGGFSKITPETDSLVIRNYNLSSTTFTYRFSFQEDSSTVVSLFDNLEANLRSITIENNITGPSVLLTVPVDIQKITIQLFCNAATTPVTFILEQVVSLAGGPKTFQLESLTLPTGSNTVQVQIPFTSRTGQFRLNPTGTFTNYSYRLIFN